MLTHQQLTAAAELLETEARRRDALLTTAAVLRDLGALKGQLDETERRAAAAKADLAVAEKELDDARMATQTELDRARAVATKAGADAEHVMLEARKNAAERVTRAEKEAAAVMSDAVARASEVEREALDKAANAEAAAEKARRELADLEKTIAAASLELDRLTANLEKARAEAARILGG
ncbi:MAG TPA: hypothetical protein VEA41_12225 [Salinarimonas sp.]|nr:hypothetical protein [Salinarimonas sp.]